MCLPADSVCLGRGACMGNGTDACGCQTYKIVENKAANKKYLLHQRGCTRSTDATVTALKADVATFGGEFEIPLKSVAVDSSTYFPFLEQIGERAAIRLYNYFTTYGSSPCIRKQFADSWTKSKSVKWDATNGWWADGNWNGAFDAGEADSDAALATVEATFASAAGKGKGTVLMSDTKESTFYGMGEWTEYIALWFNREQVDDVTCPFPRAHA